MEWFEDVDSKEDIEFLRAFVSNTGFLIQLLYESQPPEVRITLRERINEGLARAREDYHAGSIGSKVSIGVLERVLHDLNTSLGGEGNPI